jgi:predicted outer membrane protein
MGIADLFGFGKKEKAPFKIPREVSELRTRIETENRENYPNLVRYQEIIRDAKSVKMKLQELIAQKEHAAEASRIMDDLQNKLARLAEKIGKNKQEARKENKQDYVEKNIDYLERKSMRNNAKTLFTDFLEAHTLFLVFCKEGRPGQEEALDSATARLINAITELHYNFFKVYGQDSEIRGLKDKTLVKISELVKSFEENEGNLQEKGLKTLTEMNLKNVLIAAKGLSAK